jgi:glycosyltransferase involved in cell wall biosynthesis
MENSGGRWTRNLYKQTELGFPLVSIVTVTFNASKHLEQALQSILNQNYANIELIVIDGGSTDSTLEIIKKLDQKIDFWQSEPDFGIYDAMNKGLALARGEWVGFKNADDWYTPFAISTFVNATFSFAADVWYGNSLSVIQEVPLVTAPFLTDHCQLGMGSGIDHRSSFVRTEFHKLIQFDLHYKLAADLDVFWRLKKKGAIFQHIEHFLSYKRFGGASDGTFILNESFNINRRHAGLAFAIYARFAVTFRFWKWKAGNFLLLFFLGKDRYNRFKARNLKKS